MDDKTKISIIIEPHKRFDNDLSWVEAYVEGKGFPFSAIASNSNAALGLLISNNKEFFGVDITYK